MTAEEYTQIITRLGLNKSAAGRIFGATPRTGLRWANGEAKVPRPVALVLRLAVTFGFNASLLRTFSRRDA